MTSPAAYMRAMREEFPELVEDLDEWDGSLYLQSGELARYCQALIDNGQRGDVRRVYEFARRWMLDGDDEVQNAIGVAFVEHLNFHDGKAPRRWAFELLPDPLRHAAISLGVSPDHPRRR